MREMNRAATLAGTEGDPAPPLWSELFAALPPASRRAVLDALVSLSREARQARAEADRLRPMLSRVDRIKARDAAIKKALALYEGLSRSGAAKALARDLLRYAAGAYAREKDMGELPAGASDMRRALHSILRLNDGRAIGWRRLFEILH